MNPENTPNLHDEHFMRRAIELARQAWGQTHPNPMVGALIVEEGQVAAEGFHHRDGEPHAERNALAALGRPPKPGATLYVTLEPCSTEGRTGSCCDAILKSGIKRVVYGATDPNSRHAGRAKTLLHSADIEVVTGVLADDCADLNLIFNHWITHETPLIAGKIATTLDGKIATRIGQSRWITSEAAREDVHSWRRLFPAIAVGAMTTLKDNPRLTSRERESVYCPRRFVFDGLLRTASALDTLYLFTDEYRELTTVVTTQNSGEGYVRKLRNIGVQVWILESPSQRVPFDSFRKKCAKEKITGVYVEGGRNLLSELLRARQLDYLFAYTAPVLFADEKSIPALSGFNPEKLDQAIRLQNIRHSVHGADVLMRGHIAYPEKLPVDEVAFLQNL